MTLDIRPCSSNADFDAVHHLEITIWDVVPADAITPHMLHVIHHIGGIVMGAFDGDKMVGMAVATPMQQVGHLWSHMAGVLPDYQGQGIGFEIKQVQKQWALEHAYTAIHWSFDPAMRRNANFNFHQLGATTQQYHDNFYGVMTDGLNAGVPSDRFEAIWYLDRVKPTVDIPTSAPFLLHSDNDQAVLALDNKSLDAPFYAIACPYDFPAIKRKNLELATTWRYAMRSAFHAVFEQNYQVVNFITERDSKTCYYLLQKIDNASHHAD